MESENSSSSSGTVVFNAGMNDNNYLGNCTIKNSDTVATRPGVGVYFFSTFTGTGNSIVGCDIYNFDDYGIYVNGGPNTNTLIDGCEIYMTDDVTTTLTYGIYVLRANGLIIENSKIYNLDGTTVKGIYVAGSSTSGDYIVRNNFISLANPGHTSGILAGIDYFGYSANSMEVYFNSIYLGGSGITGTSTTNALALRDDANIFKAYNNAVYSARSNGTGTGKHYAVYISDTNQVVREFDYNSYFTDGIGGVMGFYQGINDVADLSTWRTSTGLDASGLYGDPGFIGNDDLHIKPFINLLDGKGLYFASIPNDIDGDTRNATTPDIGADEYAYVPPSVVDPTDVSATAISGDQINIAFTPNGNNNNVVIVFNLDGNFTTPSGPPPAPGNLFAGGTLIANTTTSPYNHTGLTPLTTYYYRLFSYDGVNYSFGVNANATTPCGVVTDFFENFDGVTTPALPSCWAKVGTTGSVYTQTSNNYSAPNCLYIYSTSTSSIAMVSLPPVSNAGAGTHWLKFYARGNVSVGGNLQIGYLTNPVDPLTFVPVDTVTMASLTYQLYTAILGTAPGSNQYLAIRHTGNPASSILIDNVSWEAVPTSPIFAIDPASADFGTTLAGTTVDRNFTITNDGGSTLTINSGGITLTGTNADQFTLGSIAYPINLGLGENEVITVSFAPTSAGAKSATMQIVHNATGSPALVPLAGTALPQGILFEDFTGTTFPPAGWTVANLDAGTSGAWGRYTTSPYFLSPPASASSRWESTTIQNNDWLITPKLTVVSGDSLVFWWRAYSSTYTESMVIKIGLTNDPYGTWTDLDSLASNSATWMRKSYNLSVYSGNVYIAFVNRGLNKFRIFLDDIQGPQVYVPAVDLAFTDFYQATGLPVPGPGEKFTDYKVSENEELIHTGIKNETSLSPTAIGVQSTNVERLNPISYGGVIPFNPELVAASLKGVIENFGLNAAAYNLNWTAGGVAQPTYNGPSVPASGTDTATISWTSGERGTFMIAGDITVAGDEVTGNNTATPFRMRVYPDTFTRTIYDRGDNTVDTYIGFNNAAITFKAGVRFTAPANDIKLAGVDFICRTETVTGGTWEIQIRDTSSSPNAPGAVLYEKIIYDTVSYYASAGDYIHFAFDDTAPIIPAGDDYWITIKAPLGILYPCGAHNNGFTPGRSYYENSPDTTTWSPLIITTERAWIMRSVEVAASNTFQLSVNVANGWNMVSIPGLHPVDQNVGTWWAYRVAGSQVFKYQGGYTQVTTATPGEGYWMKQDGARVYNTGDEWPSGGIQIVPHAPLAGASGWNMIGGYELSVTAANVTTVPGGLQSGPIFKYSGGYTAATTIDPGFGYWIKLTGAGQIIIPETMAKESRPVEYFAEDWGRIVLTDAAGISYTLYAVKGEVDLSQYELPPAPPAGMYDFRFTSGRIAEDINSAVQTIEMSGVVYPLTVKVEGMDIRLMDESGKMLNTNLKSGEDVVISDATIQKLKVSGELLPTVYSLEQNYPNPFNPSTVIEFSLPEDVANVKLSIYNALGEKVAELVNTSLQAGRYQYQWNAGSVATGMYIYELRTDKFVSVKKMLLLK
ncbi:MAG: choice-of-anchor J domain-containing protein [bacterium]|nr:choice-of-anchor J domain-containing protein [bacterium]